MAELNQTTEQLPSSTSILPPQELDDLTSTSNVYQRGESAAQGEEGTAARMSNSVSTPTATARNPQFSQYPGLGFQRGRSGGTTQGTQLGNNIGSYFQALNRGGTNEPTAGASPTARALMLGQTGGNTLTKGLSEGLGYGLGSIPSALISGVASVWSSSINLTNAREARAQDQAQFDTNWKAATDAGLFSPAQFGSLSSSMGNTYGRNSVPTLRARPGSQFI